MENTNNIPMEDLNMKAKFYICEHCGNLVTTIHNAGVPLVCCGEKMKELVPNTVEASGEKHLPVAELSGSRLTVTVGAVEHPMADVHYIQWIFVEAANSDRQQEIRFSFYRFYSRSAEFSGVYSLRQ